MPTTTHKKALKECVKEAWDKINTDRLHAVTGSKKH
jgi:hypothetical protein